MNKLSTVALSAVLAVAGVAGTASAQAHSYVGVGIERGAYVRPYYAPYFQSYGWYRHHEFGRGGFDRFHHERWHRW